MSEQRTWWCASRIPYGVHVRIGMTAGSPTTFARIVGGNFRQFNFGKPTTSRSLQYALTRLADGQDFIEVPPGDSMKPGVRTWKCAEDVPDEATVAGIRSGFYAWKRNSAGRFICHDLDGDYMGGALGVELNDMHLDGFIEVLP